MIFFTHRHRYLCLIINMSFKMKEIIYRLTSTLCLVALNTYFIHAQEAKKEYVWHRNGIPVYAAPSAHNIVDSLPYGKKIRILETLSIKEDTLLFAYPSDTVSNVYNPPSKWMLIEFDNTQRGYVSDTYLLEFPTNITARMPYYFSQLSTIVEERNESKTDRFCSRSSYIYKNGIRYTHTDLGPCEACGHSVTEISLPGWTLHQAFVFITNFDTELWDMNGTPIESYLELVGAIEVKESYPSRLQWEHMFDSVTLTETENGVEVRIDTLL